jgi:hypothetical protein
MSVFYFNIGSSLQLMVVPETRVYMDGHPILTHSYSLYKDVSTNNPEDVFSQDDQKKQANPNYLGYITFEIPGRVFNYVPDGLQALSREEVEQAVEQISHYRDNPDIWKHADK